jgi:regulator of sirC expression with transglutaminase-like and TPR domain
MKVRKYFGAHENFATLGAMQNSFRQHVRARFTRLVSRSEDEITLAEAALLIAAEEYPRLEIGLYLEKLENLAQHTSFRIKDATNVMEIIEAINRTLFDELGFQGNRENYYDPRNSYLNEVIDRRLGIPITLSVVYLEIARMLHLPMQGIGLPGHFILGFPGDSENIYVDVFNGGRLLTENACADLVAGMSGGKLKFTPNHLAPVTKKQILTRMLSNLLNIYVGSQDFRRAIAAIERILLIIPDSLAHIRDYGLLLGQSSQFNAAIEQLERYRKLAPTADDADEINEYLKTIRKEQARLN